MCEEIKYPCVMVAKNNKKLVVWFRDDRNGTVVESGGSSFEVGEKYLSLSPIDSEQSSLFMPYVRPKEYEYQVLYNKMHYGWRLSAYHYRSIDDFKKLVTIVDGKSMRLLEETKREVK